MTDQQLELTFQDRTLEPRTPSGTPVMTTSMWTAGSVADYADKRQQAMLKECAPVVSHYGFTGDANTAIALTSGQESAQLTGSTIDCLRASVIDYVGGTPPNVASVTELPRESSWTLDAWNDSWESSTNGAEFYAEGLTNLPTIYLASPPNQTSSLDVILVETSATLNNTGVPLVVPDELATYVLYGMLADAMNQEGESNDPTRAKYCEQRWREGILLGKQLSAFYMRPQA